MKKKYTIILAGVLAWISNSGPLFAQAQTAETGLSIFIQVELIVFLLILSMIFFALTGSSDEENNAPVIAAKLTVSKPVAVTAIMDDLKLERLLKFEIIAAAVLSVIYLIILIKMLF